MNGKNRIVFGVGGNESKDLFMFVVTNPPDEKLKKKKKDG